MEHKFLRLFKDGVWTGSQDRVIRIDGVEHDMDEYAKEHGIVLPDSKGGKKPKKEINIDVEDKGYEDMEQQVDEGDSSVD
jgi:hypothetical protein